MQINELISQAKIDRREAELLLGHVLKQDQVYLRVHGDKTVTPANAKKFAALANRRSKHEPIAYLIKSQPFMGRDFIVDRNVLIPRPETEILAQLAEQHLLQSGRSGRNVIVDVGTGSGCLAITLALAFPKATVIASDVSTKALAVAKQNAKKLKANVRFVKSDLLSNKLIRQVGDMRVILVANLPYLPSHDKKTIMPDVAKYEPAKALFTGGDGSMLVKKLLEQIHTFCHLERSESGERSRKIRLDLKKPDPSAPSDSAQDDISVFLEIDPRQALALKQFAKKLFLDKKVQIKKDLCGKDRFLIVI